MYLFIQREDCILPELWTGHTFGAACVKYENNLAPKLRPAIFPLVYFSQRFQWSSVFGFSCCGVFSCWQEPPQKGSTTSWKQHFVRMTSPSHKVFYASFWLLSLSIYPLLHVSTGLCALLNQGKWEHFYMNLRKVNVLYYLVGILKNNTY